MNEALGLVTLIGVVLCGIRGSIAAIDNLTALDMARKLPLLMDPPTKRRLAVPFAWAAAGAILLFLYWRNHV